jgi:hypothetical protein
MNSIKILLFSSEKVSRRQESEPNLTSYNRMKKFFIGKIENNEIIKSYDNP